MCWTGPFCSRFGPSFSPSEKSVQPTAKFLSKKGPLLTWKSSFFSSTKMRDETESTILNVWKCAELIFFSKAARLDIRLLGNETKNWYFPKPARKTTGGRILLERHSCGNVAKKKQEKMEQTKNLLQPMGWLSSAETPYTQMRMSSSLVKFHGQRFLPVKRPGGETTRADRARPLPPFRIFQVVGVGFKAHK